MSRVDQITGKGPMVGNRRSHAMNATKRKFNVNLQKLTVNVDGRKTTLIVSAKTAKTIKNKGLNLSA
ncbi:LSU ribosomal protein L28p [Mycoplasmopsis meleagridis]|uniref:Large ribosomal subunit protein bL28 n=1 Tax=Mycoplasmopsis meleagridis ATCC 25294 TaxID=1264554 RepID=A0A0F5H0V4_9BACT|nr:50S ribosomal protein L28 [Mycoplasmopsis meleagridis]KKB26760.1 LSU ribosomal protein L28p [Mycoplasmopsis meleagridis ATCC 25294]KUH47542.1 50S ribosomal protein L28 [Mycoplasmopsis meleagridis]OAD18124.1 LSU ribosomal protein L28p [Mycoplasmopsis meleagridis]OAD18427.1 LSU ribosomal protein L28p [Mycoplasmopsis meleagridis]VEU77294.1 50S ribosomal protein L28 [Mycoplasmopsis meleagridis]